MSEEKVTSCLLCRSDATLVDDKRPGYQEPAIFKIYFCPSCNTSFSLPRVETKKLYESIYQNGSAVTGYGRYWEYMKAVKKSTAPLEYLAKAEDIYWSVQQALSTLVKEKKQTNILEVGSGLGYLTYSLNMAGYQATGLDISETAVSQATKTFGNFYLTADLFEYTKHHEASYDIVIFTEVIEHVEDPLAFTACIMKLLKPGGHAIITTPNKSLFPPEIIWRTENPPVHLWWLSEESMKYIAARNVAAIQFIDFSEFYKKNYTSFDLKKYRTASPQKPILDKNGGLLNYDDKRNTPLWLLRLLLSKMPGIKKRMASIKNYVKRRVESSDKDVIVCNKRGVVLCAIFKKAN